MPAAASHGAAAPAPQMRRRLTDRLQHPPHLRLREPGLAPSSGRIRQPRQAPLPIAPAPLPDGRPRGAQLRGDGLLIQSFNSQQNDSRALPIIAGKPAMRLSRGKYTPPAKALGLLLSTAFLLFALLTDASDPAQPGTLSARVSELLRARLEVPALDQLDGGAVRPPGEMLRFYAARAFRPAWSDDRGLLPAARELVAVLADAASDGLRPESYEVTALQSALARITARQGVSGEASAEGLANLDLMLTNGFLRYASHMLRGRVHPETPYGQAPGIPQGGGAGAGARGRGRFRACTRGSGLTASVPAGVPPTACRIGPVPGARGSRRVPRRARRPEARTGRPRRPGPGLAAPADPVRRLDCGARRRY